MPRLFRILMIAALAMLLLVVPSASLARKTHHHSAKHRIAHKADRNRDGLPDKWERANKLSLNVNQAGRDQDSDGANNAAEFITDRLSVRSTAPDRCRNRCRVRSPDRQVVHHKIHNRREPATPPSRSV